MKRNSSSIIHLNVTGFFSAVALLKDPALRNTAFIVAAPSARALVLDVSPCAKKEGLEAGMSLASACSRLRSVQILPPDTQSAYTAGSEMERISRRYAPLVENSGNGHLYLDVQGTGRLFGSAADCAARIRGEIRTELGLDISAAAASNKLTAKVITRTLRPAGLAALGPGDESGFLAAQDIALLPGIGRSLRPFLESAGIYDIGDLAALSDVQALALLGSRALHLRDAARGIDSDQVRQGASTEYCIQERLYFREDILDGPLLLSALHIVCEKAGLTLRKRRQAAGSLQISFEYADGLSCSARDRPRKPLILDRDIAAAAIRCRKAVERRIRLRAVSVLLSDLFPDPVEQDLFDTVSEDTHKRLQTALDILRSRYGASMLLRASSLAVKDNYG